MAPSKKATSNCFDFSDKWSHSNNLGDEPESKICLFGIVALFVATALADKMLLQGC